MKKVCKIRFYPNKTQIKIINETLGACRFVYNKFLEFNIKAYHDGKSFISGYDFSKKLNKQKKTNLDYMWLSDYSSKAIKDEIMTAEKAYKRFFKEKKGFPRFKSKKSPVNSFFFIKDNISFETDKKNIIKIPILGKIRITERNYLPDEKLVSSGRVIKKGDKYYVSFIYESSVKQGKLSKYGCGIDLGIKDFAIIHFKNGYNFKCSSFLSDKQVKIYSERIEKLQRIISKKAEINYGKLLCRYTDKRPTEDINEKLKNIMKGESYNTSQIRKLRKKINRAYEKKVNYISEKIKHYVNSLVIAKPKYITIEDLRIQNMLQSDTDSIHKYIQESRWYYFRNYLMNKCHEYGIGLRVANKFMKSSRTCSECGYVNDNLKLSDRVFICPECGLEIDRDINAAINLCNTKKYHVI